MFPLWVLLSIGGVVLAVGGTLFDKYLLEKYFKSENEAGPGALIIFSAYFLIIIVFMVFSLKFSAINFSFYTGIVGLTVGALNGLWILLYLLAINKADVSKVIPLFQTIPIFGLFLGIIILGEFLRVEQIIAASIIISGALFLMYSRENKKIHLDVHTLLLMLSSSFFVALSQVLFKFVSLDTNYWTATFWLGCGFVFFGICLFLFVESYRRQFVILFEKRVHAALGANAINEFFDNAGELLFLAAVVIGPVALVQSTNAYEPLLIFAASIVLAKIKPQYFNENISQKALTQKIIGIIIILLGSVFLYNVL